MVPKWQHKNLKGFVWNLNWHFSWHFKGIKYFKVILKNRCYCTSHLKRINLPTRLLTSVWISLEQWIIHSEALILSNYNYNQQLKFCRHCFYIERLWDVLWSCSFLGVDTGFLLSTMHFLPIGFLMFDLRRKEWTNTFICRAICNPHKYYILSVFPLFQIQFHWVAPLFSPHFHFAYFSVQIP